MEDNFANSDMEEEEKEEEEKEEEEDEERWDEPPDDTRISHTATTSTPSIELKDKLPSFSMPSTSKKAAEPVNLMALNTNKAGMEGLDKERINRIIMEASKGSRFYENEKKKEAQINVKVDEMKQRIAKLTEQEKLATLTQVNRTVQELEESRDLSRTIMHLDMDAFYAAVEMRDDPSLKDKPMAVGGMSMLSTSNYHARKYGVRAAMPGFIGKKLCPNLIIVPGSFDKYRTVSRQVREILAEYDPNFCPMSLDEAYLDMTDHLQKRQGFTEAQRTFVEGVGAPSKEETNKKETSSETDDNGEVVTQVSGPTDSDSNSHKSSTDQITPELNTPCDQGESSLEVSGASNEMKSVTFGLSVEDAVEEIRFRIQQRTQLTASAGIAPNCMLAKICSDKNKPNGQYRIQPNREAVMSFVDVLPIRKVSGIGKVTERILSALGVHNCADLYQQRALLHLVFSGISSHHFLRISLGLGSTRVERDSERKSMSTERTFHEINKQEDLYSKCRELCEALAEDLAQEELKGKTVAIKIKTVKFEVKTRASTVPSPVSSAEELFIVAKELLKTEIRACQPDPLRLRLMGVRLSSLEHQGKSSSKQDTITKFFKRKPPTEEIRKPDSSGHLENAVSKTTVNITVKSDYPIVGSELGQTTSESFTECNRSPSFIEDSRAVNNNGSSHFVSHVSDPTLSTSILSDSTLRSKHTGPLNCPPVGNASMASSEHPSNMGLLAGPSQSSLVCPVCNKAQTSEDLAAFNVHVDICLNSNTQQVDSSESSVALASILSSSIESNSLPSTDHGGRHVAQAVAITDNMPSLERSSTIEASAGPSGSSSNSCLVCPICNKEQNTSGDLEAFNTHVDMCLNRSAIKEILNQQAKTDTTTSRDHKSTDRSGKRSGSGQQSASKRRRHEKKQGSTLDKFFS